MTTMAWQKLLFPLFGFGIALLTLHYPSWNFDALGYAGVAQRWLGATDAEAHQRVYADARAVVPEREFNALRAGSNYRKRVARYVPVFASQLPMYANKPLYAALTTACVAAGVNSVAAPFYLSACCYGVLAALLAYLLVAGLGARAGWLSAISLAVLPPLLELGRLATPDAMCALLSLVGSWLVVRRRALAVALALLTLATLARPDHVFWCGGLALWWGWSRRRDVRWAAALLLLAMVSMLFGTRVTGALSWAALFNHGFIRVMTSAKQMAEASVTLEQYWVALGRGLRADVVLHPTICPAFACLTAVSWFITRRLRQRPGHALRVANLLLQVVAWATLVVQFLVFPFLADRFFAARYLLVVLLSLELLKELLEPRESAPGPDTSASPAHESAR
jgi:hypothetical protein